MEQVLDVREDVVGPDLDRMARFLAQLPGQVVHELELRFLQPVPEHDPVPEVLDVGRVLVDVDVDLGQEVVGRAGSVLLRPLEPEVVEHLPPVAEHGRQLGHERVRLVLERRAVGARLLVRQPVVQGLQVRVVVPQDQGVAVVELPVDPPEDRDLVLGLLEGPDIGLELLQRDSVDLVEDVLETGDAVRRSHAQRIPARVDGGRAPALGNDREHRLVLRLPVDRDQEVGLVADDGPCEADAELLDRELLRFESGEIVSGPRLVAEVAERRAVELVRPALRYRVDDAARVVAVLDVEPVGDDLELLDRLQRERERDTRAPAVLPEERVVRVHAVDRDVRGRRPASAERELAPRRHLRRDADEAREVDEIREVATQCREIVELLLVDESDHTAFGHVHLLARDRHGDCGGLQRLQRHVDHSLVADGDPIGSHLDGIERWELRCNRVDAGRQEARHVAAVGVGLHFTREAGLGAANGHGGCRQRGSGVVRHPSVDGARRESLLSLGRVRQDEEHERRQRDACEPACANESWGHRSPFSVVGMDRTAGDCGSLEGDFRKVGRECLRRQSSLTARHRSPRSACSRGSDHLAHRLEIGQHVVPLADPVVRDPAIRSDHERRPPRHTA